MVSCRCTAPSLTPRSPSYLLLTTDYLPLTTYYIILTSSTPRSPSHLLLATCYLPLTTYYLLLATHYSLLTTYHLPLTSSTPRSPSRSPTAASRRWCSLPSQRASSAQGAGCAALLGAPQRHPCLLRPAWLLALGGAPYSVWRSGRASQSRARRPPPKLAVDSAPLAPRRSRSCATIPRCYSRAARPPADSSRAPPPQPPWHRRT